MLTALRNHKVWTGVVVLVIIVIVAVAATGGSGTGTTRAADHTATSVPTSGPAADASGDTPTNATDAPTTEATTTTTVPTRTVAGAPATLGAGTFAVGTDLQPGVYDVTAGTGRSGNFVVTDANGIPVVNEILGTGYGMGVPKVRVVASAGDSVKISGLSQVSFAPVTTPFVLDVKPITLYTGVWTVGQDIAPGSYVATAPDGQSGNFVVDDASGVPETNEILGTADGMGVPEVTVSLDKGDVIHISGLATVAFTPR